MTRVDQAVAAAVGDVGLGEAVAQQVARVVAQPEVGGGVGARVLARALGVGLDHHGQLGCHERVGPDPLAREARVLGRHEVGVGAERALGGEVEHLRPERGGDHLLARHGPPASRPSKNVRIAVSGRV